MSFRRKYFRIYIAVVAKLFDVTNIYQSIKDGLQTPEVGIKMFFIHTGVRHMLHNFGQQRHLYFSKFTHTVRRPHACGVKQGIDSCCQAQLLMMSM